MLIVQEILTQYRLPVFNEMAELSDEAVVVFSDHPDKSFGQLDSTSYKFKFVKATWKKFLFFKFDFSIFKIIHLHKSILHVAEFKNLNLWFLLLVCLFTRKKIWLHGQGGYKNDSLASSLTYFTVLLFSNGYICYTEYSSAALRNKTPRFLHKKIFVVSNTLYIDPVIEVPKCTNEKLFYIGRVRKGSGIEIMLDAADKCNTKVIVIGSIDNDYKNLLLSKYNSAIFKGAIFEENKQREYAKGCIAGIYGGDAGLSVVHYMALGLPVIVHDNVSKHMGPEPSYVKHMVNGLLFQRDSVDQLVDVIITLKSDPLLRNKLAANALETFKSLSNPTMGYKFLNIMEQAS